MIKKCKYCEFETDNIKIMANHVRWKHQKESGFDFTNYSKKISEAKTKNKIVDVEIKCEECGKFFKTQKKIDKNLLPVKFSSKHKTEFKTRFCSTFCAHKQGSKFLTKEGLESLRKHAINNLKFMSSCSNSHLNQNRKYFSSKREREILEHFKEKYPEDGWTFGPITNKLNCDMYSRKLKIAFEYDGIWHFKDIHNQLKRKQEVDKLLEEYCIQEEYRLIRIDENKKLSLIDIEKLIYHRTEPILKIGDRYLNPPILQ